MVQKLEVVLIDDLDGGQADTTVRFGWDGAEFEIDLSAAHAAKLQAAFEPFIKGGRKVGGRAGRRSPQRVAGDGPSPSAVREWAKSQGMQVSDRGRVPIELVVKFQAATVA